MLQGNRIRHASRKWLWRHLVGEKHQKIKSEISVNLDKLKLGPNRMISKFLFSIYQILE